MERWCSVRESDICNIVWFGIQAIDGFSENSFQMLAQGVIKLEDGRYYNYKKSIEMGAYEIEIEYKDGYEEITVLKNEVGYGIAKLDSVSEEASSLRNQLYSLQENKQGIIRINGTEYKLRIEIYESFGEDVFRLIIEKS